MAFVQLEDKMGEAELIVFPKQFERYAPLLTTDHPLWAVANVSVKDEQGAKLIVNEMGPLSTDEEWSQNQGGPMPSRKQSARAPKNEERRPSAAENAYVERGQSNRPRQEEPGVRQMPPATAPVAQVQAPAAPAMQSGVQPRADAEPKLYLRVEHMNSPQLRKALLLCEIFSEGKVQVILFDRSTGKYVRGRGLTVLASPFVLGELSEILGSENVVLR